MDPTPAVPSPKLFDLSGRNVLITGATRGNVLIAQISKQPLTRFLVSVYATQYIPGVANQLNKASVLRAL